VPKLIHQTAMPRKLPHLQGRVPGNKGKTWADQFIACLVAFVSQSKYV